VQENLKTHKEKECKAQQEKQMKNKAVQEAQMKQIMEKKRAQDKDKLRDIEHFKTVGINSSDVYYLSHDAQI